MTTHQSGNSPRNFTVFALIVLSLAFVGPRLDEEQATADSVDEARQAPQDKCGGPEADVQPLSEVVAQCRDKHGRKTIKVTL